MHSSTSLTRLRRLIVLGTVVACAASSAVGAFASRTSAAPDVFERYAATHNANSAAAPDVLERYMTTHSLGLTGAVTTGTDRDREPVATPIATRDVFERYAAVHNPNSVTAPDVLERYVTVRSLAAPSVVLPAGSKGIVDDLFRDPKPVGTPVATPAGDRIVDDSFRDSARHVSSTSSGAGGLDWEDFGIGAGAMLGLTLLVAGLSLGVVALRHRSGRLETS